MSASFSLSLKWGEPFTTSAKSIETCQWKNVVYADMSTRKDAQASLMSFGFLEDAYTDIYSAGSFASLVEQLFHFPTV